MDDCGARAFACAFVCAFLCVSRPRADPPGLPSLPHPHDPRRRSPRDPKLSRGAPRKKAAHTAMSDIKESLAELRYYKEKLFRKGAK